MRDAPDLFEGLRHGDLLPAVPGSDQIRSLGDAEIMVQRLLERTSAGSELHFSICTGEGRAIGMCAIFDFAGDRSAKIGYWLDRRHRGKGYGREAVQLLTDIAFGQLKLRRLVAVSKSSNEPSLRLLHSIGFKQDSETAGEKTLSLERRS
jgi:RimJ/RimL family protein N-acetyltransferase